MGKIPAAIIIIVGIAVSIFSYFLNYVQGSNSFTLFVIFGVLMFLYGIFRLITNKKEHVEKYERHISTGKHQPIKSNYEHNKENLSFCPYCGSIIRSNFRFCYSCGSRLKE